MLMLAEAPLRLIVLHQLVGRLSEDDPEALRAAGIEPEQLARLKALSALDLGRLAALRELRIGVSVDAASLRAGLRALALADDAKALETYFIRHGATWQMMAALFKLRRKLTLQRRCELGAWRQAGRTLLPNARTRERIGRAWLALEADDARLRYYRLHQTFPYFTLAVLEVAVREFEAGEALRGPPTPMHP